MYAAAGKFCFVNIFWGEGGVDMVHTILPPPPPPYVVDFNLKHLSPGDKILIFNGEKRGRRYDKRLYTLKEIGGIVAPPLPPPLLIYFTHTDTNTYTMSLVQYTSQTLS